MAARWTTFGLAAVLGVAPLLAISACGSDQHTSASTDGGGTGDDATVDGADDGGGRGDGRLGDGGGGGDGGGFGGDGSCSNVCPANVTCGRITGCDGQQIACGSPCPSGYPCLPGPGGSQSCGQIQCAGKCGEIGVDSCGQPLACPACPGGQVCVLNQCVPQPTGDGGGTPTCGSLSCNPAAGVGLCGTVGDGCGHTATCTCPTGLECVNGTCTSPPPECSPPGTTDSGVGGKCGSVLNACGSAVLTCTCATGDQCVGGVCAACPAPSCPAGACGTVTGACGTVDCGNCPSDAGTCYQNTCCSPKTCAQAGTTGCGPVDLGCGTSPVVCNPCNGSDVCYQDSCCTPQTCAQYNDGGGTTGCGAVNLGCGVQKSCAPCSGSDVCYNDACCTPQTCAQVAADGGVTGCDPVPVGCGQSVVCAPCQPGYSCQSNVCVACVPKTCADYGNTGCNLSDGCGHTLDCCGGGTSCAAGSNLCCGPGQVVYLGACCAPTCDPTKPTGTQFLCGQSVWCVNNGQ